MIRPPWKLRAKRWPHVSKLVPDRVLVPDMSHHHDPILSRPAPLNDGTVFECACGASGFVSRLSAIVGSGKGVPPYSLIAWDRVG
jgi:hypothetical protein